MGNEDSALVVHREGEILRIGFLDRNILEEARIQTIATEVDQLIEQSSNPKLLISFENVEHLSSAALGTLIAINNKIQEKGGQLRLSDIDPRVHEIFLITKLNTLFQIHEKAQQAVASFK